MKSNIFYLIVLFLSFTSIHAQSSYTIILTEENGLDYLSKMNLDYSDYQTFFIIKKENTYSIESMEYYGITNSTSSNIIVSNLTSSTPTLVGLNSKKDIIRLETSTKKNLNIVYLALIDTNNNILSVAKLN